MNKSNWPIFFKERTPLVNYILLSMGPTVSAFALQRETNIRALIFSFLGFFLFFLLLRMMDEYKDYDKDVLAHPTRPLPRGLIAIETFKKGVDLGIGILLGFAILLFIFAPRVSFYLYSFVIFHLWLMYKEFYISKWINARPLLYAISHQIILIPLCYFALSLYGKYDYLHWIYAFSVLFSFFTYEICRKLDPDSHPVLKTYLQIYGLNKVIFLVSSLLLLLALSIKIYFLNSIYQYSFYLIPLVLFLSLILLKYKKLHFKKVEALATFNLLLFLYSGIFYAITNKLLQ